MTAWTGLGRSAAALALWALAAPGGLGRMNAQQAQPPDAPPVSPLASRSAAAPQRDAALEPARRLIARRSFAEAADSLRAYLANRPGSAEGHTLLAYCLLRTNHPREALPEYTRAAQLAPPTSEDLTNVAQAYALLGAWPDAVHWSTRAVEADPNDADAWYSLGRIQYSRQHFTEALACFEKTLALAPLSMKAENNRGLALEGLNRNDEAIAAYRQAIAWGDRAGAVAGASNAATGMEQPLLNLGTALLHRGEADQALPLLTRAAQFAPGDAKVHEQLGHLYLNRQELPAAASELERAVALEPGNGALHFLLGQTYRRQGLGAKAQAEFARASAIMGTHSSPE